MSLLDKIKSFLCPLGDLTQARRKTPMDLYIERHNPQSLQDVERLAKQYLQGNSAWEFNK